MSARGDWNHSGRELFAKYRKKNCGRSRGGERRTCSYHFRAVVESWIPLASRLCHRSAEHTCNKWRASTGYHRKKHKVNKTTTETRLWQNNIGDGGAVALAESLKATLVMRFRPVRATLLLLPARNQPHRRRSVICVTSVFRCCSGGSCTC